MQYNLERIEMKTFERNLVFTAQAHLTIEASSQDEAIQKAWNQVQLNADLSNPDGVWELGYVDEIEKSVV